MTKKARELLIALGLRDAIIHMLTHPGIPGPRLIPDRAATRNKRKNGGSKERPCR
jgi:hypothetical protein